MNCNLIGKEFEDLNLNDSKWIIENIANGEVINIDSKYESEYSNLRKKYIELSKEKYSCRVNYRSSLKGDHLLVNDDTKIIIDSKGYSGVQSRFKFPEVLDNRVYSKTIDSNIKYTLDQLDIKFHSMDMENLYKNLINNKTTSFREKIGYISRENFIHILSLNELGLSYNEFKLSSYKYFIVKDGGIKYIKYMDIENITEDTEIELEIFQSEKSGYIYLFFHDKKDIIYILSQREGLKRANCAFLLNSKFSIIKNSEKTI